MTQQSLSYVIRTLEQELKCTLFRRTASGLELTEQGIYFFRRCSHILEELYDTYEVIHKISSDTCESLRISLSPCFYNMLLHALPEYCGSASVAYTYCTTYYCLENLQHHQANATILPYQPIKSALQSTLLGNIPISVVLLQNHPLAHHPTVPVAELCHEQLLLPQTYQPIYEALFISDPSLSSAFRRTVSLPSPLTAIHKCAQGQGVVLMDEQALANCIVPLPAVRALPLSDPLSVSVYCVYPSKQLSHPLQAFIEGLQTSIQSP